MDWKIWEAFSNEQKLIIKWKTAFFPTLHQFNLQIEFGDCICQYLCLVNIWWIKNDFLAKENKLLRINSISFWIEFSIERSFIMIWLKSISIFPKKNNVQNNLAHECCIKLWFAIFSGLKRKAYQLGIFKKNFIPVELHHRLTKIKTKEQLWK